MAGTVKQTRKEKCGGQKPNTRWLGASEVKEWSCINDDFKGILEGWNLLGKALYNYGMERCGVYQKARKEKQGQPNQDDRLK